MKILWNHSLSLQRMMRKSRACLMMIKRRGTQGSKGLIMPFGRRSRVLSYGFEFNSLLNWRLRRGNVDFRSWMRTLRKRMKPSTIKTISKLPRKLKKNKLKSKLLLPRSLRRKNRHRQQKKKRRRIKSHKPISWLNNKKLSIFKKSEVFTRFKSRTRKMWPSWRKCSKMNCHQKPRSLRWMRRSPTRNPPKTPTMRNTPRKPSISWLISRIQRKIRSI